MQMNNLHWILVWFVVGILLPRELSSRFGDAAWDLTVLLNIIGLLILFYKLWP